MNARAFHYDFKQKLNKIDSQQYRNLRVPEIDWKINEAIEMYVKLIAEPRQNNYMGFETSQRSIDDLRTLVVNNYNIMPVPESPNTFYAVLPERYMFYLSCNIQIEKPNCVTKVVNGTVRQHDDKHEQNSFEKSSFEWSHVNVRFYEEGIKIFTDGTFTPTLLNLNFIREHLPFHNAQDYLPSGSYVLPDGATTTGPFQDCELPKHTHREIVDLAVLITTNDLQSGDYALKQAKTSLNKTT